jgi:dTDP-4-amino-4,6-dideoxygalactose transaminase
MKYIPLFNVHMPETVPAALQTVLFSGYLADGKQVHDFEDKLRNFVGNPNVTTVSDISGALTLSLYMAGVRPGDEVIASPLSCTASTMPIANLFAKVVWCDVDPLSGMINANLLPDLITSNTKAVLYFHWSGNVANIELINSVSHQYGLKTIEDASEGFGAEFKGKRLGNTGADFSIYSFQAIRHITTGEGGAIFFSNPDDAEKGKWLKRYGIYRPKYRLPNGSINEALDIPLAGYNFYMTNIAATIGMEQFNHVDMLVGRHRENGSYYEGTLNNIPGITTQYQIPETISAYWTYSFLVEQRESLIKKLQSYGIGCQPLHVRNDAYSCFNTPACNLPGVDYFNKHTLSIPSGWWVSPEEREFIVSCIKSGW